MLRLCKLVTPDAHQIKSDPSLLTWRNWQTRALEGRNVVGSNPTVSIYLDGEDVWRRLVSAVGLYPIGRRFKSYHVYLFC